jgi:hypothetical protein
MKWLPYTSYAFGPKLRRLLLIPVKTGVKDNKKERKKIEIIVSCYVRVYLTVSFLLLLLIVRSHYVTSVGGYFLHICLLISLASVTGGS